MKNFVSGIVAGALIAIGGTVFLSVEEKPIGALFFAVALLCICFKGYSLYTGRIGYIAHSHTRGDFSALFAGLLGNIVGAVLCGIIISFAIPAVNTAAVSACDAKIAQPLLSALCRGVFCGILMYFAVSIFKENKTPLAIVFCIPVFILCGFEHSIADIFYFTAARRADVAALLFLIVVIIGNSIGSLLTAAADRIIRKDKA